MLQNRGERFLLGCPAATALDAGLLVLRTMSEDLVDYTEFDRDTFLEAEEALKFGIVDKVFAHRPKDEETGVESGSGGAPE